MHTFYLILALLATLAIRDAQSACRATRRRCCTGKDSECFSHGARISGLNITGTKCFCDENCVRLKDCCTDIWHTCPARHCQVTTWSAWSRCGCGHSEQKRTRKVIRKAGFGGERCPVLEEAKSCWVRSCKRTRHLQQDKSSEIALILPATFGALRKKYSPRNHWNWNLHRKYWNAHNQIPDTSSCATYEVVSWRRGSCQNQYAWSKWLHPGMRVCVECHPNAMKRGLGFRCNGDGVERGVTQWSAMRVRGCHGGWRLLGKPRQCSCGKRRTDFIFV